MSTKSLLRDLILAARQRPVHSVAVVGNAPMSPNADRSRTIDSCDVVFRVNGFALDNPGAEPCFGSRADVVVFNRALRATPWVFDRYHERIYLLVEPGRMTWEPELIPAWWPPDLGWIPVSNREFTVPLCQALGLDPVTDGQWATTGTFAAWIAKTLFSDARLFLSGFSFIDDRHQTSWQHASGAPCIVGPEHRIDHEGELLAGWQDHDNVTVLN